MSAQKRVHFWQCAVLFACLPLVFTELCRGEDWPKVIRKLERAGAKQRREQLPVAYNNYAIELSRQGDWSKAAALLQQAVALAPRNKRFQTNLATVYLNHAFETRQQRQTNGYRGDLHSDAKRLAKKALKYKADLAEAHVLIGDIEYDNQNLRQARFSWSRAKSLDPSLPGIQDRIDRLGTEYAVENQFDRAGNAHFDLRYQEGIDPSAASDLRMALNEARREVGQDLKYWPRHKIVVLIYSEEAFARIRPGPDWVGGLYDGKIRVPFPKSRGAGAYITPTLMHEYTHAVIHDIAGQECPIWLNEGVAEYQEAKLRKPSLGQLRLAFRNDRLVPLAHLNEGFKSRDAKVAQLAYEQSYSIVKYAVKTYGFFRLRRILEQLAEGTPLEAAVRSELRVSLDQLERRWQNWLPGMLAASAR